MDVIIYASRALAIDALAEDLVREVKTHPKANLGLPTGNTYTEVYRALQDYGPLDFQHIHSFNLDEYIGIPSNHPGSFKTYMTKHLYSLVKTLFTIFLVALSVLKGAMNGDKVFFDVTLVKEAFRRHHLHSYSIYEAQKYKYIVGEETNVKKDN